MTSSDKETLSNTPTENDTVKIKFLFANRDGIHVEIECSPSDTIENITKTLQSKWPEGVCNDFARTLESIFLICLSIINIDRGTICYIFVLNLCTVFIYFSFVLHRNRR